jgi:CTP:molybdopterin cytidylyltransferase MocA
MGGDKALLKLPCGATLLEDQVRRVMAAGIGNVRVVLGYNCEKIRAGVPFPLQGCINSNWKSGYFSSIKCGLQGVTGGALLLPLDTAGVPPDIIKLIYKKGLSSGKNIIPTYGGKGGHPVFLRPALVEKIHAAPLSARLDHLLLDDGDTLKLPAASKNVLNNINTPEEWSMWLKDIS